MRKILVYFFLLIAVAGFSQDIPPAYKAYMQKYPEGPALNKWDSLYLMKIPEKKLPVSILRDQLPPVVDNSTLPYLRPVFEQQGPSCGQAAMVGYNFTYEMAYKRDQPAQFPQTQYPTHFTWNFQNGGNGWYGVSYFHSIEILRTCGNMNSSDYGDYYDDGKRWINGYDMYYNGMFNRVKGVYSIKTGTAEGILALKHWLYDHMGEGNQGGVASYYANTPWNAHFLNDTTPEGGKHVVTDWFPIASHAMTIIGYNDSVRWDYNNDGQYTNHIDLNNDGIIDPRDWEIGAVKFVNSHGTGAQDEGFCYMMYKCLSETFEQGGVWNREVHILDIDEDYMPLMTYKITLKHDQRNRVKIFAGVSQDTSDTSPEWFIDFPIINYQGDEHYLQGHDTAEALKSLEFGLDITPLLSYLQPGEPAKFFFMVDEDDPFHDGNGEITAFTLMDYTSGQQEIISEQTPLILENDSRTIVSLIYYPDFNNVDITTEFLPPFTLNEACSLQLEADGGTTPYSWDMMYPYRVEQSSESLPVVDQTQVLFSAAGDTIMPVALGFDFPFFGELYDTVYMHINGHLQFDGAQLPWPYMQEPELQLRRNRIIAPAEYFPFTINNSDDDGGWVELSDSSATFRWKLSIGSNPGTTEVNIAARIRQNGEIEFIYGTSDLEGINWISGISAGNNKDYVITPISGLNAIVPGTKVGFFNQPFPQQISLSETGLFTAISNNEEQIYDIVFRVTDDHGLSSAKALQFTSGPYLFFSINAGGDDRVEYGDTVSMDLEIKNGGQATLENTTIAITSDDPFIEMLDASCTPGTLLPGQVLTIPGAFLFAVSFDVPDQHDLLMNAALIAGNGTWNKELQIKVDAPILQVKQYAIGTQDGILDPGETAPLMITLQNTGNAAISGVNATLSPLDPEVQVLGDPELYYGTIGRGMSVSGSYSIHADESVPHGFITHLVLSSLSSEGIQRVDTISFRIGKTPVFVIDMDPANHSGPGIYAMLNELDVLANYEYNITQQIFNYQSLFICLGYQNFNHVLTLWEGQKLTEFLESGGKIYMEGRKTWRDDPPTPIQPMFNINTTQFVGVYDTINGIDGTFTQGLVMNNDASTPFSFYGLEPIDPAFSILADNNTGQVCAVAYDAGTYKTIGALFEYGTMSDISPDAMNKLMTEYLEFFGIEVEPVGVEETGGQGEEETRRPGEKETGGQGEGGEILRVWPNPASWQLAVGSQQSAVSSQQAAVKIEIYDLFGWALLKFDNIASFPFQIDISGIEDGMYILKMTDTEGHSSSSKFLKIAE